MSSGFYRAFEDKYRGSRELVKKRLSVYSPFILAVKNLYPGAPCVDLGCGRGEWLELLQELGLPAQGVDLDDGMLEACEQRGLTVRKEDAVQFLKSLPDDSQAIVSGFHIAEHLPFNVLQELIEQAFRVLRPCGLLVLETPNPENIVVGSSSFYLDPSHYRPLPLELLSFLAEFYGFSRCKVLRLQEPEFVVGKSKASLAEVLACVSPDYSIVAQKKHEEVSDDLFSSAFGSEYGLSFNDLSSQFDSRLEECYLRVAELEFRLNKYDRCFKRLVAPWSLCRSFGVRVSKHIIFFPSLVWRVGWALTSVIRLGAKLFVKFFPFIKEPLIKILGAHPGLRSFIYRSPKFNYAKLLQSNQAAEILVDITHVYRNDLKTGIQRVVRSVLEQMGSDYSGRSVRPVYLTDVDGFWHYCYVGGGGEGEVVVPKEGDIFLGLDLNSNIVGAKESGLFEDWKRRGVQVVFVVYDILPISNPEWWPAGVGLNHEWWLRSIIESSDKIICISKAVLNSVEVWATSSGYSKVQIPSLCYFHLGADLGASQPTCGVPGNAEDILSIMRVRPSFLAVGTIEPRKGHAQLLNAFEILWESGQDIVLVVFGKQGWMVETVVEKLRSHPQFGKKLFWVEGGSDEYLEKLYSASSCLIAASYDEGFGLPLIEAAQHKIPIIARDIPVFREVAGDHAFYFDTKESSVLAVEIQKWLGLYSCGEHPDSNGMRRLTWSESSQELLSNL